MTISNEPLSITPNALAAVIDACTYAKRWNGGEACGFVFGNDGVARRVVAIKNVSDQPHDEYEMSTEGILASMAIADQRDEDLLAVYHSHVASVAIPSEHDLATPDHKSAYLIVSLKDPRQPSARAWRIGLEYIGQPQATEVLIHVTDDGAAFSESSPPGVPWALTQGNKVQITYRRAGPAAEGESEERTNRRYTATIDGYGTDGILNVTPKSTGYPRFMPLERIVAVKVLAESPLAARVRQKSLIYARGLANALSKENFTDAALYAAYLAAAFPEGLKHE